MTDTAITRKTRFVDLPANLQQLLVEIEQQKQVQLQIGSSIVAEDTEHSLQRVSRSVQRLAQDLQLVKMTLNSDRHRVDEVQGL
ncbi:Nucleoporin nup49/NSP49 (Nuclear pore protein nup49/NSP49), partial [Coemansia sp. S610]